MRLTEVVHTFLKPYLAAGDWAVDGTIGKGRDTVFLTQSVGNTGKVWGFDVQPIALQKTKEALEAAKCSGPVSLFLVCHSQFANYLPIEAKGNLKVIMFNLGYLPGSAHTLVTKPETTVAALNLSLEWLQPGGMLSVLLYRAHAGAEPEVTAVNKFLQTLSPSLYNIQTLGGNQLSEPVAILIKQVSKKDFINTRRLEGSDLLEHNIAIA
jgi:predicted methyltransferase